ncbi:MAG TPA: hypothetical protein VJS44_07410 [Pyrinomonadaceae bacterium]|nr:hypothetical protein [Pyrinomonadaceae bacterium]
MKKSSKNRVTAFIVTCALLIVGGAAVFAKTGAARMFISRPEIKVALSGSVHRGQEELSLEKAQAVGSGEVVSWSIVSQNAGNASALDYRTVGQIPKGTSFVEGSAKADGAAAVTYSIDGGKTFTAKPMIAEKQPDGTMKQVPAPVSMYTQVRYEWADPLAAGGKLTASYQVRVK